MLRQLPPTSDTPPGKVKIELSVIDTGKVRSIGLSGMKAFVFNVSFAGYQPALFEGERDGRSMSWRG